MSPDKQKDPEKKDIEYILNLLSKNKFIEAQNAVNKLIASFPNSCNIGVEIGSERFITCPAENFTKQLNIGRCVRFPIWSSEMMH